MHLHRRVHAEAIDVSARNQRLGGGDELGLDARALGAKVVATAIDLPKVGTEGVVIWDSSGRRMWVFSDVGRRAWPGENGKASMARREVHGKARGREAPLRCAHSS